MAHNRSSSSPAHLGILFTRTRVPFPDILPFLSLLLLHPIHHPVIRTRTRTLPHRRRPSLRPHPHDLFPMLLVDEALDHARVVGAAFVDQGLRDQVFAEPAERVLWPVWGEGRRERIR